MKYRHFVYILFMAFAVIITLTYVKNNKNSGPGSSEQITNTAGKTFETKTDNKGSIEVKITPVTLASDTEAIFSLQLDTHSGSLDYDLAKIAKLLDNTGTSYNATSWNGGAGGHHLSGTLSFPKISKETKSVKVVLTGIDNTDREFSWNL